MSGALQIVVPGTCPNKCKFCVSLLHDQSMYKDMRLERQDCATSAHAAYINRLAYAREACDTLIYTGVYNEAIFNEQFMHMVSAMNEELPSPFYKTEIQTTGIGLKAHKWDWLRNICDVSTIALSISDLFDDDNNAAINRTPQGLRFQLDEFCETALEHDFNIRLTLIMNNAYDGKSAEDIFMRAKELGVQQITFKYLATFEPAFDAQSREINTWIKEHRLDSTGLPVEIENYIKAHGRMIEPLSFGDRYSVHGISTVIDPDCMKQERPQPGRYLILRENCRLYTKWDDPGSMVF